MSTTTQTPESLSFSGNLKPFLITSTVEVTFVLNQGATLILSEKYQPNADNLVKVNVQTIIDHLLDIAIPNPSEIFVEQTWGALNFTATIDDHTPFAFRVVKGGVSELDETPTAFMTDHFLTWQLQDKEILQAQPEWIGIYPISAGVVKAKAYYANNTTYTGTLATLEAAKLYSVNTSWGALSAWLIAAGQSGAAVVWDVWYEVAAVRKTPIQRYRLRNAGDDEHVYLWTNTLGGIDSISFTGACEQDYKLVHKTALFEGDNINEYDVEKPREFRQSTGYLERDCAEWMADFFYSRKKYMIRFDGAVIRIALTSSKIVDTSQQDEVNYEFTYRLGEDLQLLNLDRISTSLPAPEGLDDFFLTELLSGLTAAQYADNLLIAVQSPFSQLWQKLSMSQLWGGALPGLVDGTTIVFQDGKLKVIGGTGTGTGGTGIDQSTWTDITNYINSVVGTTGSSDSSTKLISGAITRVTGLTFESTDLVYRIFGVPYTAFATTITLAPADPNLPRIDSFYVDTNSNLGVATGIPATNPVAPSLLPNQFELYTVSIAAGALVPTDIEIAIVYDQDVEWISSTTHDDDVTVNTASTESPENGSKCVKVAIAIPDKALIYPTHFVGEDYGGGIIIWLDSTGKRGLIAAKTDTVLNVYWESLTGHAVYGTGGTGLAIGTGLTNTGLMLASDAAKDWAVMYVDNLIVGTFSDWFMPSIKELLLMYGCRWQIGGFGNKTYWSSSENAWNKAWCLSFANGVEYNRLKNNSYCVRAIRAFDETTQPTVIPVTKYPPTNTSVSFTASAPVSAKDGILSLYLKSSDEWLANSVLTIDTYLGVTFTGRATISPSSQLFHYQPGNETWQRVVIPIYNFNPTNAQLDRFRFSLNGSWLNNSSLWMDQITFQYTKLPVPSSVVAKSDFKTEEVTLLQDTDYPYVIGTTKPKFIQVVGEEGDVLFFKRTLTDGVYGILIIGTDGQTAEINVQT